MLYDESVYPEPHIFNPDRWLKDGEFNPDVPYPTVTFGFRRCLESGPFQVNGLTEVTKRKTDLSWDGTCERIDLDHSCLVIGCV
jgi:hypothetical protein